MGTHQCDERKTHTAPKKIPCVPLSPMVGRDPQEGGDHQIGHHMCKKSIHRALLSRWSPLFCLCYINRPQLRGPPTPESTMYRFYTHDALSRGPLVVPSMASVCKTLSKARAGGHINTSGLMSPGGAPSGTSRNSCPRYQD